MPSKMAVLVVVMASICALANAEHPLVPTLRVNLQGIADAGAAKYVCTQAVKTSYVL